MNYLIYIEHAAENLQFYHWYCDYVRRFNEANTSDTRLSPEWTQAMEDEATARIQKDAVEKMRRQPRAAAIFKGTDFEKGAAEVVVASGDPFSTPPGTPNDKDTLSFISGTHISNHQAQAHDAFSAAGATQPCTSSSASHIPARILLTLTSHHPTFPRGNQPRDQHLHHGR